MKILHLDNNHPLLIEQLTAAGHENVENYTITKKETEAIIAPYDGIVIRSRFNIDKDVYRCSAQSQIYRSCGCWTGKY